MLFDNGAKGYRHEFRKGGDIRASPLLRIQEVMATGVLWRAKMDTVCSAICSTV